MEGILDFCSIDRLDEGCVVGFYDQLREMGYGFLYVLIVAWLNIKKQIRIMVIRASSMSSFFSTVSPFSLCKDVIIFQERSWMVDWWKNKVLHSPSFNQLILDFCL